jgi:hypothetical protein
MLELNKHYSIRSTLLKKKLFGKVIKAVYEHVISTNVTPNEKKVHNNLISVFILICSVNTAKFYIPGETKEIEALRRRGILNGSILISDVIVEVCQNN